MYTFQSNKNGGTLAQNAVVVPYVGAEDGLGQNPESPLLLNDFNQRRPALQVANV